MAMEPELARAWALDEVKTPNEGIRVLNDELIAM